MNYYYFVLNLGALGLIRKLHNSDTWTNDVNVALKQRLDKIEELFPNIDTHNLDEASSDELEVMKTDIEINLQELCTTVWPALSVIGGLDRGLKMGGFCRHKTTGKKAVVLGVLKKGLLYSSQLIVLKNNESISGVTTVNVQWEHDQGVSDVAISNLEFIEPEAFNVAKFSGLNTDLLLQLARLSGITNEISFPLYEFSDEEETILNAESKRRTSGNEEMVHSNSDSQVNVKPPQDKRVSRTVETLTNEIVTNILDEVTKIASSQSETILRGEQNSDVVKNLDSNTETLVLQRKFASVEEKFMKLAFLQFSALKTLGCFVMTSQFTELFLVNDRKTPQETDCLREIMYSLVDKGIDQCKLKNIISVADAERAMSILHMNHAKNKCEADESVKSARGEAQSTPQSCSSSSTINDEPGCSWSQQGLSTIRLGVCCASGFCL